MGISLIFVNTGLLFDSCLDKTLEDADWFRDQNSYYEGTLTEQLIDLDMLAYKVTHWHLAYRYK